MRRVLVGLGAVAFVVLLLLVVELRRSRSGFSVGPLLPRAKIEPQLVSTWDTALLLAPDGSLWAWGGSLYGASVLLGKTRPMETPQQIGSSRAWRQVTAGYGTAFGIQEDGSLWGWGLNFSGQLTRSNLKTHQTQPVRIGSETDWVQVSAGAGHCLGLRRDGSLWGWGQNDHGQVGDGTGTVRFSLTQIGEGHDWKAIAAGAFNSFALKTNGTIWGWGLDPITGGKKDDLQPQLIEPHTNWMTISAGDYCVLGVQRDGTLWLRGQNAAQTLRDYVVGGITNFVQVGADKDWLQVYAGQSYFFAHKKNGAWWACGINDRGQLGFNSLQNSVGSPKLLPWKFEPWALAPGFGNTLVLTQDGSLWTWGERLGSERTRKMPKNLPELLNWLSSLLNRRGGSPANRQPVIDQSPHLIWSLPPEARAALEKESAH